jgi:hypothetical protein
LKLTQSPAVNGEVISTPGATGTRYGAVVVLGPVAALAVLAQRALAMAIATGFR